MDPIDIINIIPPQWHAYILLAITATTLAMPLLEWIANKTANTWDNALVARLAQVLALVPRVGLGNRQKAAITVARTSKAPPPLPPVAMLLLVLLLGGCAAMKPVLRTVVEVARHLCLLTAEEQDAAARDGLTPEQFCAAEENLRPFIDEVLAAKQRASGKAGLTAGGEQ